jgi:hypothetical protein
MHDMKPVFIGGCHRSGTTLLGDLLGAHPQCLTTPESQFKINALEGAGLPQNRSEVESLLERAENMRSLSRWNLQPSAFELPGDMEFRYSALMQRLVSAYGETVDKTSFDFWVDHTPTNVRHLRMLFSEFPEARAIHLVRDGRGVAASVLPLDWGPNTIVAAAHWWAHHIAFGLAAETHFGGDRILRVRYEDLVAEPGAELERICRWLGVDYVDEMQQGGGFSHPSGEFRYHALIHQAPNAARATAWTKRLSDRQVKAFESRTRDLLSYLDYELKFTVSETDRLSLLETMFVEPFMVALNMLRYRIWLFKRDRR